MSSKKHLSTENALAALAREGGHYLKLFRRGSLHVETYQPEKEDLQS